MSNNNNKDSRAKYADKLRKLGLVYGKRFNPYRCFNGIFIPDAIAALPRSILDACGKLVLGRLLRMAGENGLCWGSMGNIGSYLGVTRRMVKSRLDLLVELGLIEKRPREDSKYEYWFLWHKYYEDSLIGAVKKEQRKPEAEEGQVDVLELDTTHVDSHPPPWNDEDETPPEMDL